MSFASFTLPGFSVCLSTDSCPRLRHGCRPDWWWPKRSREVRALQDLGEIHYWSRPVDPFWFERDVELMPSPLAEQSAARLRTAPLSCVPHVPYIPHPCPQSTRPFHVAPRAGTPVAARLFSVGQSPVSAQAPPRLVGMDGCVDWAPVVSAGDDDDADWVVLAEGIADAIAEAVTAPFAEHTRESALMDLRSGRGGRAGWVDRWMSGGCGDGDEGGESRYGAVGAAMGGVDHLVFSRLKPTFPPRCAGGGE